MRPSAAAHLLCALLACALLLTAAGCTIVVRPPRDVEDPVDVHIAGYGHHAGLILPRGAGGAVGGGGGGGARAGAAGTMAEYTYGEWGWFAQGRTGWWRVPTVLFWPTRGALGRRELHGSTDPGTLSERLLLHDIRTVRVERAAADRLLARLDDRFASSAGEATYNAELGLDFVQDDARYWILHQCNDVTARWLRELGCEVSGWSLFARYRVVDEPGPRVQER